MSNQRTSCERCGECCRKGGPTLHTEDIPLFSKGVITALELVTLRKGELARDEAADNVPKPLAQEIVKLRGRDGRWLCEFLDNVHGCTIYENRPSECRAMECWDTSALTAMYETGRITRYDLIPEGGLRELVDEHEDKCSYARLGELAEEMLEKNGPGAQLEGSAYDDFLETVRYDAVLRNLLQEKTGCATGELDFYFGRPLTQTIVQYGLTARRDEQGALQVVRSQS